MSMILYFGSDSPASTSSHRAAALKRLGYELTHVNIWRQLPRFASSGVFAKIHYRTGYVLLQNLVKRVVREQVGGLSNKPILVWVDSGELIGPTVLSELQRGVGVPVILYNLDDPTGPRDGARFYSLRKSLPLYDLSVTVRQETETEMKEAGASRVLRVFRSYDESAHCPFPDPKQIPNRFRSDVVFVGTWMRNEHRDVFIQRLLRSGINVSIWGAAWERSPFWGELSKCHRGGALSGRDYVASIQGAKICLGMLSQGNRDLHTQRSAEIPYAGGLFCAERTTEHLELYREWRDAVFWEDAEECVEVCKRLLSNEHERQSICQSGMARIRELRIGNEDICRKIVHDVLGKNS